ncbi:MAG: hypothetical protein KJ749_12780, partial [Planctomycetes bacterium]|nr:hypothetical protein [Planctomycetota bacterium]
MAVIVAGFTGFAVWGVSRQWHPDAVAIEPKVIVKSELCLPPAKANLFFAMLAPDDVKVEVASGGCGIVVTGTPRETAVLTDFADLVVRFDGVCEGTVRQHIMETLKRDDTEEKYLLPKAKAKILFAILALGDVPLLVSIDGRHVIVRAAAADQATVSNVVEILRGNRL